MRIAILASSKNAYSESFIQAHRDLLKGDIFYLYGGRPPKFYDEKPLPQAILPPTSLKRRVWDAFKYRVLGVSRPQPVEPPSPLEKFFVDHKIDVVLAEYGPNGVAVMEICPKLNIPLVVHFHGFDASSHSILYEYKIKYQRLFELATKIIVVSRKMQDMLQSRFSIDAEKLVYNVYGPNPMFLKLPVLGEVRSQQKYLLAIGRFVEKKAPHLTLFAFAKALENPDFDLELYMIGDGLLQDVCKALVTHLGIVSHVHFLGIQPHDKIPEYMQQATAFVQHSVRPASGDMEGTPVAILEAMAAGLPVISTRHAGIPDVVVEEETGLLCDEGDVKMMAAHMVAIAQDKKRAYEMGQRGRERIQKHFTLDRHINTLQHILEEAVKQAKSGG